MPVQKPGMAGLAGLKLRILVQQLKSHVQIIFIGMSTVDHLVWVSVDTRCKLARLGQCK